MKALAIDTSTYTLGIAVIDEDQIIGEWITNIKKNHSVRVMPGVETLLKEVDVLPNELDRIIVAKGPGSYTGIRIGVTIAKTLAWSLNIPLVGVSSLEVLANNGRYFNGYVCPIFDARRGQVYTGLYAMEKGKFQKLVEDQNVLFENWLKTIKKEQQQILFLGNDVKIHKEMIKEILGDQAVFSPVSDQNSRPADLALLGTKMEPVDVHSFVPNYIRLAEAEAKWLASKEK